MLHKLCRIYDNGKNVRFLSLKLISDNKHVPTVIYTNKYIKYENYITLDWLIFVENLKIPQYTQHKEAKSATLFHTYHDELWLPTEKGKDVALEECQFLLSTFFNN